MSLPARPVIGLVGSAGAYGRWLTAFFERQMGLLVIGHDPADPATHTPEAVIAAVDVLLFSVPIRHTPTIIAQWIALADGRERDQLWIDITSVKAEPVAAMLRSQAEVAGLHPMCAPPKAPTLKGRVMVVCQARVHRWQSWLDQLCLALRAQCVVATSEHHDRVMSLVQALVHAGALTQASVLRELAQPLGGIDALLSYRSTGFELDVAVMARILALNPAIYEDIQFGNPYVLDVLDALLRQLGQLRVTVASGDQSAREAFRDQFLVANRQAFGDHLVAEGNYGFERLGYLLADLAGEQAVNVFLPEDRPGSLRRLLAVFEAEGVNLDSIHSSRTPSGEVHFRLGIEVGMAPAQVANVVARIEDEGIGRVL